MENSENNFSPGRRKFLSTTLSCFPLAYMLLRCADNLKNHIYSVDICNVTIDFDITNQQVTFFNKNDSPMYVKILDSQGRTLGWNMLFTINEQDTQSFYGNYGDQITVNVYDVNLTNYTLCDTATVNIPNQSSFARQTNRQIHIPENEENNDSQPSSPVADLTKNPDFEKRLNDFNHRLDVASKEGKNTETGEAIINNLQEYYRQNILNLTNQ